MPRILGTRLPRPDDPDILQRIADATEQGHPITTAGPIAGIGATTAYEWYQRGLEPLAEAERRGTPWEELGSHAKFTKAVKDAEARFVDRNLRVVNDATRDAKGWLPAMTLLERRRPQDFGRRDRVEVDQRSVSVSLTLTAQLPAEDLARVLELAQGEVRLLQAGGTAPDPAQ